MDFTQEEGMEVDTEDDTINFAPHEGMSIEEQAELEFTICDVLELSENCFDSVDPDFLNAYLFVDDAEPVQPLSGLWEMSTAGDLQTSAGCPPEVASAAQPQVEMGNVTFSDPFVVTDVMDFEGSGAAATYTNPAPNVYVAMLDMSDEVVTSTVRYTYVLISPEQIAASMEFVMQVPGVIDCQVWLDFDMLRVSE